MINRIFKMDLEEYCHHLARKYEETLDGKYRIKYNDLYDYLFSPVSEQKKLELYRSFRNSLDIDPILTPDF